MNFCPFCPQRKSKGTLSFALVTSGGSKCSHANKNKNPFALVAAAHLRCGCNLRKSKGTLAVVTSGGSKCSHANKNKNPKLKSEGSEGSGGSKCSHLNKNKNNGYSRPRPEEATGGRGRGSKCN